MLDDTSRDVDAAREICARHGNDPAALLEILHEIQDVLGCVPEAVQPAVARALNLGKAEVHGVVSFYHDFRAAPAGRVVVKLCRAESCQSRGAAALIERVCARLGVELGGTSATGVTVEPIYCLGLCASAPSGMVDGRLIGRLDDARIDAAIAEALA